MCILGMYQEAIKIHVEQCEYEAIYNSVLRPTCKCSHQSLEHCRE